MSNFSENAYAFVYRLLSNPTLTAYTPLQKEEHVSRFLETNIQQLEPTLTSAAFFPGYTIDQISQILHKTLHSLTNESLLPAVSAIIQGIDYSFLGQIVPIQEGSEFIKTLKTQILQIIEHFLAMPGFRQTFSGNYTALRYNIIEGYMSEIFKRKRHIYYELTKFQRLRMNKTEIKAFVEICMLLRALVQMKAYSDSGNNVSEIVSPQLRQGIFDELKLKLNTVPVEIISSIVNSAISFQENSQVETTARLAAIFSTRGKTFARNTKIDRGADTPDKSWFGITRRNYKFYGFDGRMLDEMYIIAAENGW